MKIMTRLSLLSLAMVLLLTTAVVIVGSTMIDRLVLHFQQQLQTLELQNASQAILQDLNRSGLRAAVRQAQQQQSRLQTLEHFSTAQLFIVDGVGQRVVYHPVLESGAALESAPVNTMFNQRHGIWVHASSLQNDQDHDEQFTAFQRIPTLDWLIGISIDMAELRQVKNTFLQLVGLITFAVLISSFIVFQVFGRQYLGRIGQTLEGMQQIEAGTLFQLSGASTQDELGLLQQGINQMSDRIQQRTRALQATAAALREREERLRWIIDSNIIGIFFWELDGRITDANDNFLSTVGYSRAELLDHQLNWMYLTPEESGSVDQQALEEFKRQGYCQPYRKLFYHRSGATIPVLIGGAFLHNTQHRGWAFVVNLSAQQRADEESRARRQAEAANEAKSRFLANMNHELRTPLNAILGYAQILKSSTSAEQLNQGLDNILFSGEYLLTLINDALDLSKAEAGKLNLMPRTINLPQLLGKVTELIRVRIEHKDIDLQCVVGDIPNHVMVDDIRLQQVLLNLLGNAIKFTDRGYVCLRVSRSRPDHVRFEVADSGIGIAAEHLPLLFNDFEQVGNQQQRGGTGLGLAISRQLVQLMGGDIEVQSQAGQGSLFSFELLLPDVRATEVPALSQQTVVGYLGLRRHILVVDDVVTNRAILTHMLHAIGFTTSQAADGLEAIHRAEQRRPDAILMDISMPVLNGLEATQRLRLHPTLSTVPVLIVSAHSEEEASCQAAGAVRLLAKPIRQRTLCQALGEVLQLQWIYQDKAAASGMPEQNQPAPPPEHTA
ncbi:hypothetical protein C4K68_19435 [Pokkaliibacter plantistimulans]|uniref:histidine kinase n=1 Tax=Proteobacteria bacterium 228 TaxID=2083153 RepID=A0A2S5KL96_9PROT|nr:ATP-binding protein [Pokkaliibacter plantistimulans]PPC75578.1 hypothetical protein C4K68_19435 [Pokkaliibacter plantistimulans]